MLALRRNEAGYVSQIAATSAKGILLSAVTMSRPHAPSPITAHFILGPTGTDSDAGAAAGCASNGTPPSKVISVAADPPLINSRRLKSFWSLPVVIAQNFFTRDLENRCAILFLGEITIKPEFLPAGF